MNKESSKQKNSRILWYLCLSGIVIFFCALNFITPYVADDFKYHFSFATNERITSVLQLPASIYSHAFQMNGRLAAHFLVQFFLLLPKPVFNIVNSLAFGILLKKLLENSGVKKDSCFSAFLLLVVFCMYWLYLPAWGQVNLWVDGAVNYLWSMVTAVLVIAPYFSFFTGSPFLTTKYSGFLFCILCFVFGNFLENVSAAVIFGIILILFLNRIIYSKKTPSVLLKSTICMILGYFLIYLCPAERANKAAKSNIHTLIKNFTRCTHKFIACGKILFILWIILLIVALYLHLNKKTLLLSCVCILMALASNYILLFAAYYPDRSCNGTVLFLLQGVVLLTVELFHTKFRAAIGLIGCIFICMSLLPGWRGTKDIYRLYIQSVEREQTIQQEKSAGASTVYLVPYRTRTKYSAAHGLRDVMKDPTTWPNSSMAYYYSVDKIIAR